MKKFLIVAAVAAFPAAGCIQTMPDGSIAAAPGTSSLLGPNAGSFGDAPPPAHQVRTGSRLISADPDPQVRSAIHRNPCEGIGGDHSTCASN